MPVIGTRQNTMKKYFEGQLLFVNDILKEVFHSLYTVDLLEDPRKTEPDSLAWDWTAGDFRFKIIAIG